VDAVVAADKLREAALAMLQLAIDGGLDWQTRRAQKKAPLKLNAIEGMMVFETAKGFIAGKAGKHYPAPLAAVSAIQKAAGKSRDEALAIEAAGFAKLARTPQADALIGLFLNDQLLKKKARAAQKIAQPIRHAAVLGAGIMGGGIAYQSASRGTPILMKDIAEKQIELGLSEANKLLAKQVERGKLKPAQVGEVLGRIRPTLSYGDFGGVDIVVEAVVENPKVKKAVLAEVEGAVPDPKPSSPPTPARSRSTLSPKACSGQATFSACTSSTRFIACRWSRSSTARRPARRRSPRCRPMPAPWARPRSWSRTAPASWSTAFCSRTSAAGRCCCATAPTSSPSTR
jgi:short chain enoyl-CoA hydratase (EC 4.2.1.17)/3-hydroxyacyl-CoA dehydrogenase (EC 1.1.1.35)